MVIQNNNRNSLGVTKRYIRTKLFVIVQIRNLLFDAVYTADDLNDFSRQKAKS